MSEKKIDSGLNLNGLKCALDVHFIKKHFPLVDFQEAHRLYHMSPPAKYAVDVDVAHVMQAVITLQDIGYEVSRPVSDLIAFETQEAPK